MLHDPEHISILPFEAMSEEQRRQFETPPDETLWLEIGSRAFLRAVVAFSDPCLDNGWQVVQEGRYRYLVSCSNGFLVRMVLSEYLACEVGWRVRPGFSRGS